MDKTKKLHELLARQRDLQKELEESRAKAQELKNDLAAGEFIKLLERLRKFSTLLSKGAMNKLYEQISDQLKILKDFDPQYLQKLGEAEPYGQKISDPALNYCIIHLLGGVWRDDAPLHKILERLVEQRTTPGNPLKEDK